MRPLRVAFCGSVDDGKSTLLGRLMHDAHTLFTDEVAAVRRSSGAALNLAFFTDGLMIERERGITLDVAYRHLTLGARRLLLADVPGHAELVRNMATGASTADAAVLVVDATRDIQPQTRRHLALLQSLGVGEIIICLNKMDALNWLPLPERENWGEGKTVIPISALEGDNVVTRSKRMPWHEGPTLAERLQSLNVHEPTGTRAVVQTTGDWHGCHVISGALTGELHTYPERRSVRVLENAGVGRVRFDRQLPRGTLITDQPVEVLSEVTLTTTWLERTNDTTFTLLQHGRRTQVTIASSPDLEVTQTRFTLSEPTWFEPWNVCRETASALLIDHAGRTVAAARYVG